ncbi:G-type lectin S-receptor-like serine/threonine-protein kinase CES101 [Neltuma alba]|uniref:G-type lectin S-receptor-like serine/threonine-protein kinase CES101 n=1 Tax=Neltuma alba TaxID=207710 RepID=UPI0010A4F083|nr:G-type lectin S-receptor-like serine/threonine-protein kinase CES101 [Prosopis alba]
MPVISKLVILLLLILGNLGLWRNTCYAQDASDHLKPGGQLNDTNPTICSVGGSYCLQFMKIDSDSSFYYLSVYSGFLESSVWIANRNDQILNGSSEALTLDHSGVLKITHQAQEPTILYSPPADLPQDLINNTRATLLKTGNFVLQQHHPNGSKIVLWQSFDYPTDTLLPGMKLGVNHKTGRNWSLVSYSTYLSASPGPFMLEWEPRTGQLILLRRGQVYWASGVLRNGKLENLSEEAQSLYNYTIVSNKDEDYFIFSPWNEATKIDKDNARWTISSHGELFERTNVITSADDCYGYHSHGGCQLLDQPTCRHKGEFFETMYISVRDQGITYSIDDNVSLTISDCQATCWSNCHCVGFTSYDNDATGCVFYSEDSPMSVPEDNILRLYFLANRSEPVGKGGPAQQPSPGQRDQYQDSNASAKRMKLLVALIIITLFIICAILWILLRRRKIMLEGIWFLHINSM